MKLLADTCVPAQVVRGLRANHDVTYADDEHPDPGDEVLLARAHAEQRVLITLDKDFGELVVVRRLPHHGVVRLVGLSIKQQIERCSSVLREHASELSAGALVTVESTRVRIRPADVD